MSLGSWKRSLNELLLVQQCYIIPGCVLLDLLYGEEFLIYLLVFPHLVFELLDYLNSHCDQLVLYHEDFTEPFFVSSFSFFLRSAILYLLCSHFLF